MNQCYRVRKPGEPSTVRCPIVRSALFPCPIVRPIRRLSELGAPKHGNPVLRTIRHLTVLGSPAKRARRSAFTLMEVLVVIAIIAILAGLLLGAVQYVRVRADDAANSSDINQLRIAIGNFKKGILFPSKVRLVESAVFYDGTGPLPPTGVSYYDLSASGTALDANSVNLLTQIWPRLGLQKYNGTLPPGIDWSGSGTFNGDYTLEGDQCLVFFLGGIRTAKSPNTQGFVDDPLNPGLPPGGVTAQTVFEVPLYPFPASRLKLLHAGSPFYSFLDIYGTPFAFFSALKGVQNAYNPYLTTTGLSDCQTIGVMPYCAAFGRRRAVCHSISKSHFVPDHLGRAGRDVGQPDRSAKRHPLGGGVSSSTRFGLTGSGAQAVVRTVIPDQRHDLEPGQRSAAARRRFRRRPNELLPQHPSGRRCSIGERCHAGKSWTNGWFLSVPGSRLGPHCPRGSASRLCVGRM